MKSQFYIIINNKMQLNRMLLLVEALKRKKNKQKNRDNNKHNNKHNKHNNQFRKKLRMIITK